MSCVLSLAARSVWLESFDQILIALNEYVAGIDASNSERPGKRENQKTSAFRSTASPEKLNIEGTGGTVKTEVKKHFKMAQLSRDKNANTIFRSCARVFQQYFTTFYFIFIFPHFPVARSPRILYVRDRFAHFRCTKRKSCHQTLHFVSRAISFARYTFISSNSLARRALRFHIIIIQHFNSIAYWRWHSSIA